MAAYDSETQNFINKVVGDSPEEKEQVKRQAVATAKQVMHQGPVKGLMGVAMGRAIGGAVRKLEDEKVAAAQMVAPLEVLEMLNNELPEGWDDFEPETLRVELSETLNLDPSPRLMNMIGAFQTILNTNYPFELWHIFENVSHAMNENPVSFAVVQPAELDEIALTVEILKKIRPREEFEDDVCAYIAASAKNSGVVYLPPELFPPKSQMFLDQMNNHDELKERVKMTWPNSRSGEGMLAIQTQRLSEIRDYVKEYA